MENKILKTMSRLTVLISKGKDQTKKALSILLVGTILSACASLAGRETVGEYIDDASITASVKNQILQDPALKMFQIHVETFQNTVQLSGFVDSRKEALEAARVAHTVKDVKGVKNNLIVRKKR